MNKMNKGFVILTAAATISFTGCAGKCYNFGGSTTIAPIITRAQEELKATYPDISISYDANGSSSGIKGYKNGNYLIAASSRELKEDEKDDSTEVTVIAKDGVAIIVNSDTLSDLNNLTQIQIAGIYSGKITNWKDIGGPDHEIVIFNREESSGTFDCFKMVMKADGTEAKMKEGINAVTSSGDMITKVSSTPYSLGYCGFGNIEGNEKIKAVSIDGIDVTTENIFSGNYPISRNLNLVHKKNMAVDSFEKVFIDYLMSEDGQALIEDVGFISIK